MDPNAHKTIKEQVMSKIHAQEFPMRPKIYFTLRMLAVACIALAIVVISIFIFNFIVFSIRLNNESDLLGFGPRGVVTFLSFFPWALLILDIGLIVLLEWLVRQYRAGYKIPALYLLLGMLSLTILAGILIDRGTPINDRLLLRSDEHRLPPPLNIFYGQARHAPPEEGGVCRCTIVAIDGNTLTVQDSRSTTTLTILLPPDDPRATSTLLRVGDLVLIAGDRLNHEIRAFGVRRIGPQQYERIK